MTIAWLWYIGDAKMLVQLLAARPSGWPSAWDVWGFMLEVEGSVVADSSVVSLTRLSLCRRARRLSLGATYSGCRTAQ